MRAHGSLLAAAALALAASSAPLAAQGAATGTTAPKPAQPTKEQLEDAAYEVHVLISAMQSDKVEAPVKDALFECLYQNSFAKISDAIGKIIAQNPDKVAKRNPDQILGIMAGVCGYRPKDAAAAAPAPGAAPAKPTTTTPAKPAAGPAKPGTKPQGR